MKGGKTMLSEILEKHLREIQAAQKPAVTPPAVVIPEPFFFTPPTGTPVVAPSQKQIDYYNSLVKDKNLTDQQRQYLSTSLLTLTRQQVSSTIQWLVGLPWMPRQTAPVVTQPTSAPTTPKTAMYPTINQGYYAVVDPADNTLRFFQVRKPSKGKWMGWTFLNAVSGGNKLPMRDRAERERIFSEIEKNPLDALKRFGQEIGQCGHCLRQLTDADSRQFGIGPVCRKGMGL
jgi:hypothetical protein